MWRYSVSCKTGLTVSPLFIHILYVLKEKVEVCPLVNWVDTKCKMKGLGCPSLRAPMSSTLSLFPATQTGKPISELWGHLWGEPLEKWGEVVAWGAHELPTAHLCFLSLPQLLSNNFPYINYGIFSNPLLLKPISKILCSWGTERGVKVYLNIVFFVLRRKEYVLPGSLISLLLELFFRLPSLHWKNRKGHQQYSLFTTDRSLSD